MPLVWPAPWDATEAQDVAAGYYFTCAVQSKGSLRCWGSNDYGQLGGGRASIQATPVPVADLGAGATQLGAGIQFFCVSKNDGSIWCWGQEPLAQFGGGGLDASLRPVQVTALPRPATWLAGGYGYACALLTDGGVWCWGAFNDNNGYPAEHPAPFQMPGLPSNIAQLEVGVFDACILSEDGAVWCWPAKSEGQIGTGNLSAAKAPAQVATLGTSVTQVSMAGWHTCARKKRRYSVVLGHQRLGTIGRRNDDRQRGSGCRRTAWHARAASIRW
jgi:alpha-tubulin suppressor-like RCC1 family protein